MSNPIPSALALDTPVDGATLIASRDRNDYTDIQTAVNAFITAFSGGTAGALLYAASSSAVAYLPDTPTDGQALVWNAAAGRWKPVTPVAGSWSSITAAGGVTLSVDGTISISSIPATYSALRLMLYARTDEAGTNDGVKMTFNGDSGANYDSYGSYVSGATPSWNNDVETVAGTFLQPGARGVAGSTAPANSFGSLQLEILNYANTANHKIMRGESYNLQAASAGGQLRFIFGGRWRSTAAINAMTLAPSSGTNFKAGTWYALEGKN